MIGLVLGCYAAWNAGYNTINIKPATENVISNVKANTASNVTSIAASNTSKTFQPYEMMGSGGILYVQVDPYCKYAEITTDENGVPYYGGGGYSETLCTTKDGQPDMPNQEMAAIYHSFLQKHVVKNDATTSK